MYRRAWQIAIIAGAGLLPSLGQAQSSDCGLLYEVYAHALAHDNTERCLALTEAYAECVLEEVQTAPGMSRGLLASLKARRQLDDRVRMQSYAGEVKAHGVIVKAGFLVVRELREHARRAYVSSLVRSPKQQRRLLRHPTLKGQAARRSQHVLGGLAVDVAFVGRRVSMARLGALARSVLRRELGARAKMLRVVVEPYCLHIELNRAHPAGRRAIEDRKRQLVRAGILERSRPGVVPRVSDYRTEAQWRRRGGHDAYRARR